LPIWITKKRSSLDPSLAKVPINLGADAYQNGDYYNGDGKKTSSQFPSIPPWVNSWENLAAHNYGLGMIDELHLIGAETAEFGLESKYQTCLL